MPTLADLGHILITHRIVSAPRWQRVAKANPGNLSAILDALTAEPPEWWTNDSSSPPPGLTDYQRQAIEAWYETGRGALARQLALNQFILLEQLGQGGQGTVYKARQLSPNRFVAIKTLRQDSEARRVRFEQEAKALMRIQHPAVARFYLYERLRDSAGKPTDEYLIAMEYVEGIDLARLLLQVGRVAWPVVVRWAVQLLDGFAVIHRMGLIHRDVKPGNIMISGFVAHQNEVSTSTTAKLLDFGAVKPAREVVVRTGTKRIFMGTREYAAPEQWMEETVTASDLYALGATFFEALTGRPPYLVEGRDVMGFLKAHTQAPVPHVSDFNPEVPDALERLIRQMLCKDPADRGDATQLARAFRELLPVRERPPAVEAAPSGGISRLHGPAPQDVFRISKTIPQKIEEKTLWDRISHPFFTILERLFLSPALRPVAGHEPPAGQRLATLLRQPLVLITLGLLVVLVIWLMWFR
ncbi:MAG: serine/threonine-protein kinase [Gemmataceae bacterium]|nr:serine/threonine protein kinase [Gemmata sp.]MDW8196996.1 serine/threonine-protein kinase [Gemmataceae bacterium]